MRLALARKPAKWELNSAANNLSKGGFDFLGLDVHHALCVFHSALFNNVFTGASVLGFEVNAPVVAIVDASAVADIVQVNAMRVVG